jgi:hypothetical protein
MAGPSGITAKLALPYPTGTDTVDVPRDVLALATKLDPLVATQSQGTIAARPAAASAGRFYYATDTATLFYDNGSAWIVVPPFSQGTLAARPAPGVPGRYYWASGQGGGGAPGVLYLDTGSAWVAINSTGSSPASRRLFGMVNSNGTISRSGSGQWSSSRVGTGQYGVAWNVVFAQPPIITLQPYGLNAVSYINYEDTGGFQATFAASYAAAGLDTNFNFFVEGLV